MNPPSNDKVWARLVGLGAQMTGGVLGGFALGWWADKRLETAPWLTLVGVFLGAGVGFYGLWVEVASLSAKKKETGPK